MPPSVRSAVAGEGTAHIFSGTLFELAVYVGIQAPSFRGTFICRESGLEKWRIRTTIPGRTADPEDEGMKYSEYYPDWTYSVDMAMQGAIARICHKYHDRIPRTSAYSQFGERTEEGDPVEREGADRWTIIHRYLMEREFSTANMENLLRVQLAGIEELKEKLKDRIRRVVHAQNLAEEIDDQRLALEERITLLEDPLKMEEKLICSNVWAETLQKTLVLTIENRTAEDKKMEALMKEMEALKLENVKLKETISELTSFEESSSESDPVPRKRMKASEYRNKFKLVPSS